MCQVCEQTIISGAVEEKFKKEKYDAFIKAHAFLWLFLYDISQHFHIKLLRYSIINYRAGVD